MLMPNIMAYTSTATILKCGCLFRVLQITSEDERGRRASQADNWSSHTLHRHSHFKEQA